MQSLKKIIDPENLLNPGVIINNDPRAHLKNLKSLPIVEQEVDKCIECGYCEHKCPSRDITMTPRQRIVVRREMARLKSKNEIEKLQLLYKEYQYDGMDTCAVDGLCASECPVSINTGDLIKRLRNENHSAFENKVANLISKNFKLVEFSLKAIMKTGSFINKILWSKSMFKFTRSLHELTPMIPVWPESLTSTARLPKIKSGKSEVVYFPACISRMMGASATQKLSLPQTFIKLADKARIKVHPFESINGLCCGQAFSSKGFQNAAAYTMNKTIATLFEISNHGQLPIVIDVTSCTYTFLTSSQFLTDENQEKLKKMQILDSIEYALQYLIPKLNIVNKKNNVVIHPVCTLTKMNLNQTFKNLAEKCANTVSSPIHAGCCGMAGDRGFFFPELTASAVREEAIEVNKNSFDGYYSSAKTCEISLSGNSGNNYESILYLLDEVSE